MSSFKDMSSGNIEIKASKKAKSIFFKSNPIEGKLTLIYPYGHHIKDVQALLKKYEPWIKKQQRKFPQPLPFQHHTDIPILGEMLRPCLMASPPQHDITQHGENLHIPHQPQWENQLIKWIAKKTHQYAFDQSQNYLKQLKLDRPDLKIHMKDPKTRWASCSSQGRVMLSWRLAFAPLSVINYVIAHEICHLRHMNHSADFWKLVHILCPNEKIIRKWLKEHGAMLHQYGKNPTKKL